MPRGATAGKRSVAASAGRYEGTSASQQVWSAAREGALPLSSVGSRPPHAPTPRVDYNKPWFEYKDGEFFCNLCHCWAAETHVWSQKHRQRADNPSCYGFAVDGVGEDPKIYDEPWYSPRDGGEWYCKLCYAVATQGHIDSEKHKKREAYPECYGFPRTSAALPALPSPSLPPGWTEHFDVTTQQHYYHNAGTGETQWERPADAAAGAVACAVAGSVPLAAPRAPPPQYDRPWFKNREGEWYCLLCEKWATDTHLASATHVKRDMCPEWYGWGGLAAQPLAIADAPRVLAIADAAPAAAATWGGPAAGLADTAAAAGVDPPELTYAGAPHSDGAPAAATAATAAAAKAAAGSGPAAGSSFGASTPAGIPAPWKEYWGAEYNRPYYYNEFTQESVWELPDAARASTAAAPAAPTAEQKEFEC